MKILSILLILLTAYTSNVQGKNNGNSKNKNNGNSNKNKNNGGSNNDLCCEEAGQQAGLFCRCRQACAGNPCNAGQKIGFGGGKYCGNGVCCCGTGCKKSVQSDNCKQPTTVRPTTTKPTTFNPTTAQPTTNAPTTAEPTTNNPTTFGPTTSTPTTAEPTTNMPTTATPTTNAPTTANPTTNVPTTNAPTTAQPTTSQPTTAPASIPECVPDNTLTVTATDWEALSHPYTPHYFTNCVLVALDGGVEWTDNSATNRMGTSDQTITTLSDTHDGPFFDQVFSVTNDFGSDNVIRVTRYEPEPSTIILESWSLPIIAYYSTEDNNMYYIDQDNTNTIPDTPSGQVIKKNDGTTETIDWTQLSSVTFDGIVWLSEKSGLDEVIGTKTIAKKLHETNKLSLNERDTNENAFMTENAYTKDDDFITSPVGILVLVIVGVVIIVIFCFIGMRCMDKIQEKRNATVHFEP